MSEHTIRIEYQRDGRTYHIWLFGAPLDFFLQASLKYEIKKLKGEKLAMALVAAAGGKISQVQRTINGVVNDGPLGEPGWQEFNSKGVCYMDVHMKDGKANDCANGRPACRQFTDDGKCYRTIRWKNGVINDGPKGEPADLHFDQRGTVIQSVRYKDNVMNDGPGGEPAYETFANGARVNAMYYKLGKRNDGANGEPAWQEFKEGFGLHGAWRYKDGVLLGGVSRDEIDAYNAAADKKKIEALGVAFGAKLRVGTRAPG